MEMTRLARILQQQFEEKLVTASFEKNSKSHGRSQRKRKLDSLYSCSSPLLSPKKSKKDEQFIEPQQEEEEVNPNSPMTFEEKKLLGEKLIQLSTFHLNVAIEIILESTKKLKSNQPPVKQKKKKNAFCFYLQF